MKKLFILFTAITLVVACKKKEEPAPPTQADKLNGTWDVTKLDYSASVPLGGITIPLSGSSNNVGTMEINSASMTAKYDIKFLPNVPLPGIDSVEIKGNGPFTANENEFIVTDSQTNTSFNFQIKTNQDSKQIWETNTPFELAPGQTISVKLVLDMTKR